MEHTDYNFVFFGTPDVASETLEILKLAGYLPSLIVTSPDRPQGRKMLLTPPPVKVWAIKNDIPYIQPEKITPSAFSTSPLAKGEAGGGAEFDLFLVVAYGKILSEEVINMPRLGSLNIHYSLLPKYRGASPVESAIVHGDKETGITIQKMVYQMDAGPIIASETVPIYPNEKAQGLRERLIKIGGELLVKTLQDVTPSPEYGYSPFAGGELTPQDESLATRCKKIKKEDGLLNPSDTPEQKYNKFRAYAIWPRTFFFQDGKRIIVTDAALEHGTFVIKKVLPEGKKEIPYADFLKQINTSK